MKKQATSKKKWIWIIPVCVLVLALATAATLFFLGVWDKDVQPDNRLYYNVDGAIHRSGKSTRYVDSDGYVYMTFSVEGEQVRLPVENMVLATAIDMQEILGLVFNEDGVVVDYKRVADFTGGAVTNKFVVTQVEGNTVTCNASVTLKGYDVSFEMTEDTKVYDVSMEGITCGIPGTINVKDQVTAIADYDGNIMCVYTIAYSEPADLYWNVSRKYDSTSKRSTREMDPTGYYRYEMLCNGETVEVKTRDYEIACQMDSYNAPCMGLVFDENGYVIETMHAKDAVEGRIFASYSRVMQVIGDTLYTKKLTGSGVGAEYSALLDPNCKIINTTSAGVRGEYTELRFGDQIHGLTDARGKLCYIFITSRVCEDEYQFCWNFDYKSGATETQRKPDANGIYHIKLAADGEVFTAWTKDIEKVNMLDTSRFRGVKTDADGQILDVIPSNYVYGGSYFCSWYYVDKIEGNQITVSFTKNTETETKVLTGTLSKDVQIYNTSNVVSSYQGEASSLQVGDQIYAQNDLYGQIRSIYVVNRYLKTGVYYNLDHKWDDAAQCTTRTPDENGLYKFRMAYNGKEVTLYTRSKKVANDIDSQVARVLGLVLDKNGYITKAVHAKETEECKGSISVSYVLVTGINGNQVTTYKENNGQTKTIVLASDVKYINVSGLYDDHQGEYTKLRVGDKIHCLADQEKKTNYVFITSRKPVKTAHTCQHTDANTAWHTWNGKTAFPENGHYVLTEDLVLTKRITIKKDQEITLCLNGHTITTLDRMFSIYGKLTICDHKNADGSYSGGITSSYSNVLDEQGNITAKVYGGIAYLYNESANAELNIRGGNYTHTGTVSAGGLFFIANKADSDFGAVVNLYDGVLRGGNATESAGAIAVRNVGVFNMYGGTITDCTAPTGAGVHTQSANAQFHMYGGVIQNCTATDIGAGVCIGNGTATMTGGKITGCTTTGNGGSINVSAGSFTMTGGVVENGNAKEGGNLRVGTAATFTLGGNAVIQGGCATNGGNAVVYGNLIVREQAVMKDGTATNKGGNINAFANLEDTTTNIIMTGGTICGGVAGVDSGSIRLDANDGTVNMIVTGGKIEAGKAPYAPCVKVGAAQKINLTVGGNVQIDQVHLENGKHMTIHDKGLDNTSAIGVNVSDSKKPFVTIQDPEDIQCFYSCAQDQSQIVNENNDLYLKILHDHCECGGNLTDEALNAHQAQCKVVENWTAVDGSNFKNGGIFEKPDNYLHFKESGYYYLTANVSTGYVIQIDEGQQITLCLNGHTLNSDAVSNASIRLQGKLNICDCQGGGKITGSSTKTAGLVYALTSSTGTVFNLYGGELVMSDNDHTANAGVVQVANNANYPVLFNMYGGSITGGSVKNNDGKADRNRGGNIYVNGGTLNVYGGTISGGTADQQAATPALGADIFQIGGTVYLNTAFDTLDYANDGVGYLTLGEKFTATAVTCKTLADSAKLAEGTQEQTQVFAISQDGYEMRYENGVLSMVDTQLLYHRHCVCGGNLEAQAQAAHQANCAEVANWTAINQENFVIGQLLVKGTVEGRASFAVNGCYYLEEDVTTSNVLELLKDTDITLCLNGHTLTSTATGNSAIRLSGKLNICDCQGGGTISAKSPKAPGMIFMLTSTADAQVGTELNLYGGNLVMTDNNYTANAGVIQVGNSGNNPGVFNMYGGSIRGGTANKGGNILIGTAAATMNLYGGSVEGGSVKTNDTSTDRNRGGNIYVNKGTLNVYGGIISGGKTTANDPNPGLGGDIYMTGGKVQFFVTMENLDIDGDGTGQLIWPDTGSDKEEP